MPREPQTNGACEVGRDLFDRLQGEWWIVRNIQPRGWFEGIARFERTGPATLRYREWGLLCMPGGEFQGTQEYVYRQEGQAICIYFRERSLRLFQRLELTCAESGLICADADHRCGADHYRSTYEFRADGTFTIVHKVKGPRKAYKLTTNFVRLGP